MKLGSQTGSLVNHIYSRATKGQPEPEVGMGATILSWTDRHAGTIIGVCHMNLHTVVWVQQDNYKVISGSGHDGSAEYEYSPNPQGILTRFRFKNGRWEEIVMNFKTGRWNKLDGGGNGLLIGSRDEYRDPCF